MSVETVTLFGAGGDSTACVAYPAGAWASEVVVFQDKVSVNTLVREVFAHLATPADAEGERALKVLSVFPVEAGAGDLAGAIGLRLGEAQRLAGFKGGCHVDIHGRAPAFSRPEDVHHPAEKARKRADHTLAVFNTALA